MSKIVVKNTAIVINDYTLGDCRELEDNFKVYDPLTHQYNAFGMYYLEEKRQLFVPRGLDIWKIKQYLGEKYHDTVSPHPYKKMDNILIKYTPRDKQQKEALRFMIGVNEYSDNAYLPQLSVNLNTGVGKTYCSIATIAYLQIKSIVIAHSVSLLTQWKENIKEYTNLKDKDILFISGSSALQMILAEKSKRAEQAQIYLCTHGTIQSFCKQYGWDKLDPIFQILGIGMKFIDEAHTDFNNMLMIDFFSNVYKTYYVTATPARSDWRENRIYQLSIKNVPGIDLFNEEIDPHTDYIAIKYNSKPTPLQISSCRNAYGLDRNKYINYVTKQGTFRDMMVIVMDMVIKCRGRALMYVGTNESILRVYKWIGEHYPQFIGDIGIFTSLVDKKGKMEEKKKKLLLSTTKSAGLGEHIDKLKMTIVLAEPFKSSVLAKQSLGRTRDSNTVYVEIVDLGFKYTRKFYYEKLPVFNKYALSVSDTTIEQYELERRAKMLIERQKERIEKSAICLQDNRFFKQEPVSFYTEEERIKNAIHFSNSD